MYRYNRKDAEDTSLMLLDAIKLVMIIKSCYTLEQLDMADKIFDRYISKWTNRVDQVPTKGISVVWHERYEQLTQIYLGTTDDGTEHF